MFKKITTATIVLTGLVFSSASSATEVSLEKFVGHMLSTAVSATQQEISNNVEKAVLTAGNMISLEETESFATKVTITDLNYEKVNAEKAE